MSSHWSERKANWPMIIYLSIVHLGALLGIRAAFSSMWQTVLFAALLWPVTGLGITAGVHRLWAHKSYKAHWTVRVFLMLCNSGANQGSIYHWSRDHRVHHKYSETDADPHNAENGFFFAHIGWLLVKKHPKVLEAGKLLNFDDLLEDPVVRFQKVLDPWFALFMCFGLPTLVASHFWGEGSLNALLVAGFLRYAVVLHFTWLVNSAAHLYGERPYDPKSGPRENALVAVASIGEGWHNWHHKYPFDYAASEFGISEQFNPTKLFIDTCARGGLVWDRKRGLDAWKVLREKRERDSPVKPAVPAQKAVRALPFGIGCL